MLAVKIRELCARNKCTMMEVAKESGVPYETLKRWGAGIEKPNAYDMVKVAGTLGTTVEELINDETMENV